jgi:hypothetical protein
MGVRGERGSSATLSDCVEAEKMILVMCSQNEKKEKLEVGG